MDGEKKTTSTHGLPPMTPKVDRPPQDAPTIVDGEQVVHIDLNAPPGTPARVTIIDGHEIEVPADLHHAATMRKTPTTQGMQRIPERVGKYRIVKLLGQGGMGAAYEAEDTELRRKVALKFMHAATDDRGQELFRREAMTVASLDHPYIVKVYDMGQATAGQWFIAMEFLEGCTLLDAQLTTSQKKEVFTKVLEALAYAHSKGAIHRDLKLGNIMLVRRVVDESHTVLEPKVIDFGLAFAASLGIDLLEEGGCGTPAYMPPEQTEGGLMGPWSDVYSLGVILWEMLMGQCPVPQQDGEKALTYLRRMMVTLKEGLPAFPKGISPALQAILTKALAWNPANRYHSAAEFRGAMLLLEAEALHRSLKERISEMVNLEAQLKAVTDEDVLLALEDRLAAQHLVVAGIRAEYRDALERVRDKDPDNKLALRLLAACAKADLVQAEETDNHDGLAKAKMELGRYDTEHRHERFRVGTGKLTLKSTLPDGTEMSATCVIYKLEDRGALRVPVEPAWKTLATPFEIDIPMGSWKVMVRKEGIPDIFHTIRVARQQNLNEVVVLRTPPKGFKYVPTLTCEVGKKGITSKGAVQHGFKEVKGFFMEEFEVTFGEYLEFLATLPPEEAHARNPRADKPYLVWDEAQQQFVTQWAPWCHEKLWRENEDIARVAVFGVSWHDAMAYCAWLTQKLRQGGAITADMEVSLPTDLQWEAAARGADGREYPWGQKYRKGQADVIEERPNLSDEHPWPVGTFSSDVSSYGVHDMAGSVAEWTSTTKEGHAHYRASHSNGSRDFGTTYSLGAVPLEARDRGLGFRLVIPLEE